MLTHTDTTFMYYLAIALAYSAVSGSVVLRAQELAEAPLNTRNILIAWPTFKRSVIEMMAADKRTAIPKTFGHLHAIDGTTLVTFTGADSSGALPRCIMECELVTLSRIGNRKMDASFNGVPQAREASAKTAIELCNILGVPSANFEKWWDGKVSSPIQEASAGGTNMDRRMLVEIKRSFDDEKQWRVLLTVSFSEE